MTATLSTPSCKIVPHGFALGADVLDIDLKQPLTTQQVGDIQSAWDQHLILRFPQQIGLTVEELIAFSRNFGALDKRPIGSKELSADRPPLPEEITLISNVKVGGKPIGGLGDGEAVWHADMTYKETPPKGACLHAVEIPPSGGNTHFANMYLAYETLPDALKQRISGLRCVHDASRNSAGELRMGFSEPADSSQTVGAAHPLVISHHRTGRQCLLLGRRRNAYVQGLSLRESDELLDALWEHATQPDFTWTQVWSLGDMMMWDNTCTMHRRDSFDATTRRLMHRTQFA
jgi:taurine dioxygenase